VTTAHLTGGEPGPVVKARKAAGGRAPRFQGDTVTAPASGAGTAWTALERFPGDLPEQMDHVMVTAVGPAGR